MSLFETVSQLVDSGEPVVILTVVGKDGSAPRDVGAKMAVTADDEFGTIGGGTVEALAIEEAREVLADSKEPGVRTYELEVGGNTGMVCGGTMDVFIDRVAGNARLFVAGGGHIGQVLAPLAQELGYEVTVVDDREEYANPALFPDDIEVVHGSYGDVLGDHHMTVESAVAVATRGSTFDARAIAAGLDNGAGYVGLVASETKARRVLETLADDDFAWSDLLRVRSPVGYDLGGSGPEDVALAILAELHALRHGADAEAATGVPLEDLVVVRGGGDLGSGVVYRLVQAGFPVIVTETDAPTVVRRRAAFASAMFADEITIQGVTARRATSTDEAARILLDGDVPVVEDPDGRVIEALEATVVIDAIMAKGKRETGTTRDLADVVIGMGPGFEAGTDVDAVVETNRGHELGRVYYEGSAAEYDGTPAEREGYTTERVFYAPADGTWEPMVEIGDLVAAGETLGTIGGESVSAEIDGLVRGLVHEGVDVAAGTKLGDVDPRGDDVDPTTISDKALSLGGGALEAVLRLR